MSDMNNTTIPPHDAELEDLLKQAGDQLGPEANELLEAARSAARSMEGGAKNLITGAVNSPSFKERLLALWNAGGAKDLRANIQEQGYQEAVRISGIALREFLFGYMEKLTENTPWAHSWVTNKGFRLAFLGLSGILSCNMLYKWEEQLLDQGKSKSANAIGYLADVMAAMLVQEGVNLFNLETVVVTFIHGVLGKVAEKNGADLDQLLDARESGRNARNMDRKK